MEGNFEACVCELIRNDCILIISTHSLFQIIICLTFLTPNLTTHLIKKICKKFKVILEELSLINQATTKEVIFCTWREYIASPFSHDSSYVVVEGLI